MYVTNKSDNRTLLYDLSTMYTSLRLYIRHLRVKGEGQKF